MQQNLLEQKIARLRQSFKRLHRRRRADPFDDEGFLRMQKELKIIAKEMLKEKYKLLREKQRVTHSFFCSLLFYFKFYKLGKNNNILLPVTVIF